MKKKIFVTGASGFLGKNLVQELVHQGYDVTIFVRTSSNIKELEQLPIQITQGDITNAHEVSEAIKNPDVVIHTAAILGYASYGEYYDVHVEGAKNVIAACQQKGIKRVITTSTTSTFAQKRSAYGETKNIADLLFQASKLDITILKPDFIYGKGGPGFTNNLNLVKNMPLIPMVGNGKYRKQPIYVHDVVKAIIAVLQDDKTIGKTYVVAGEAITYNELIGTLQSALAVKKLVVHFPIFPFYILSYLLKNKKNPPINAVSLCGLLQDCNYDNTLLKNELKIIPLSFSEGVKLSLQE